MPRLRSFSAIYFLSVTAVALLVSLAGIGFWAMDKYAAFQDEARTMRQDFVEERQEEVKYQVDRAVTYIRHQMSTADSLVRSSVRERTLEAVAIARSVADAQADDMDRAELERLVVEALRPLRFHEGRGYYFATRLDGTELLFADHPEMEGVNLLDMQSADGKYVIRDMIALARSQGEGFYEYLWTKPGAEGADHKKIAFIKYFEPLNCFIGTGEYPEDLTPELQREVLDWLVQVRFGENGYL